jgi:hypothetical protein
MYAHLKRLADVLLINYDISTLSQIAVILSFLGYFFAKYPSLLLWWGGYHPLVQTGGHTRYIAYIGS